MDRSSQQQNVSRHAVGCVEGGAVPTGEPSGVYTTTHSNSTPPTAADGNPSQTWTPAGPTTAPGANGAAAAGPVAPPSANEGAADGGDQQQQPPQPQQQQQQQHMQPSVAQIGVPHMGGVMYGGFNPNAQGFQSASHQEYGYSGHTMLHSMPEVMGLHASQQQGLLQHPDPTHVATYGEGNSIIVDVWADQLEDAFAHIRKVVVDYPFVAMDTEFPGVVARPVGSFKSNTEFYYQTLRCNVNLLKIIQLGITFANEHGEHPPDAPCTWQFNFKFNLKEDIYAQDSIELLTDSGIDFDRFDREGIDVSTFAELLISSGLVLTADPPVKWLSFHSGYDFGYLIKVLTNTELPVEEEEFFELMQTYFPVVYDVKYLLKQTGGLLSDMCGLNKLGEDLSVKRIGPAHQAGSDSLLTSHCYFKLDQEYFPENSITKHAGVLYGLGQDKGSDVEHNQNGWTNPAITPSTPSGQAGPVPIHNGGVNNQFPSSPMLPTMQRGPQPGLYNLMR
eukprot:Rhum_TRINITY_DN14385_c4_g1::Rhum_TRINITY_DN14385_c4_g1_i1::g.86052::m.86052/K12581/CNOT7_8, CAF1, POP2; CCR4-NOT transcription complex subunit 7/8